jgi:cell shape-determining protein MreC
MTTSDRSQRRAGWASWIRPALIPWLAALALILLPSRYVTPLRDCVALVLRPGQSAAAKVRERSTAAFRQVRLSALAAERLTHVEDQNRDLTARSRRLELALQFARTEAAELREQLSADLESTAALLTTRPIEARVMGGRARGLLEHRAILGAGATDGLSVGALVLSAPTLDLGGDAGLEIGDLVLLGREVWGQIASVDGWTSTARHVTQPGFRELVQLAHRSGDRLRLGPRGVLEGTGQPLCRIRMIPVIEPVSVGDIVLTDGGGLAAGPLRCGDVVRVEQPRGADHWEIWMQPAIKSPLLQGTVAVLRTELNPARVGNASSILNKR